MEGIAAQEQRDLRDETDAKGQDNSQEIDRLGNERANASGTSAASISDQHDMCISG